VFEVVYDEVVAIVDEEVVEVEVNEESGMW
jgi:hypothetical protein